MRLPAYTLNATNYAMALRTFGGAGMCGGDASVLVVYQQAVRCRRAADRAVRVRSPFRRREKLPYASGTASAGI